MTVQPWRVRITLTGAVLLLAALAGAQSPTGTLRVKTDVPAVEVFLDGQSIGTTPLMLPSVAAGTHRLLLVKDGFKDHVQDVVIPAGATQKLFIVMKAEDRPLPPLPAKYRVMHKHGFGVCRGEMTVTAEAVDFRPTEGPDVFHIPIREMKLVSRSPGATGDFGPMTVNEAMGVRIEGPGRAYTFWVFEDEHGFSQWKGTLIDPYMMAKTKELYELVNRLWRDAREKRAEAPVKK